MSCRLEPRFDSERLQLELNNILRSYSPLAHFGQYHDGGWGAIGLIACGGDVNEQRPVRGTYSKTPALKLAPYMESLIDGLPGRKGRVRLMELRPGSNIFWHYDRSDHLHAGSIRLHIPIATNDKVEFQIGHEDCRWRPGDLWYGDFSFPHRLVNRGAVSRVHLVVDCAVTDAIKSLFPPIFFKQERVAWRIRHLCQWMCDRLEARRHLEPRIARAMGAS